MSTIRSVLAAAAIAAIVVTSAGVAQAAPAPRPTAELTGCSFDPASGTNVAEVTIHGTRQSRGVRWVAQWVHTNDNTPDTGMTRARGLVNSGDRVLRFSYTDDDLLTIDAKRGDRKLLHVRVDEGHGGCGLTVSD